MVRLTGADLVRIRSKIQSVVHDHRLPGISVGVVSGGELVYSEGFGLADIESGRPNEPAMRQRIGSITKTMVGLCTMSLVEEGKLSLEDKVTERLPDIRFNGPSENLAIKHLVTHTSGLGEAPNLVDLKDQWSSLWSATPDVPPVTQAYPDGLTIECEPGNKWAYANHGFALLGEIVARAEGKSIEKVLDDRIFGPLDMDDSDCHDEPHPDLTTPYHRAPGHDELDILDLTHSAPASEMTADGINIRGKHAYVRPRAAGGVESTIPDMAKYAAALLAKGKGIVSPNAFNVMTKPQFTVDERLGALGVTFFLRERFGRRTFGHGGGITGGWNTHLTVFPDDDLAVIVHLNLRYDDGFPLVDSRIVQAVLDAPTPTYDVSGIDPEIMKTAPGVYEPTPGHLTNFRVVRTTGRLQITARDGGLFLESRRGQWRSGYYMARVRAEDPTLFALNTGAPEPPLVSLACDRDGNVTAVRIARQVDMKRNDDLKPWV